MMELSTVKGAKVVGVLDIGYPAKVPRQQPRTSIREKLTIVDGEEGVSR